MDIAQAAHVLTGSHRPRAAREWERKLHPPFVSPSCSRKTTVCEFGSPVPGAALAETGMPRGHRSLSRACATMVASFLIQCPLVCHSTAATWRPNGPLFLCS